MSNENIDYGKLIKDIEAVLTGRVLPFIREIKEKRSGIPALKAKISEKMDAFTRREEEAEAAAKAEEARAAEAEKAAEEPAPAPVQEEAAEKTAEHADGQTQEDKQPAEEKKAAAVENKTETRPAPAADKKSEAADGNRSKTYINPEFLAADRKRREVLAGERRFPPRDGARTGADRRPPVGRGPLVAPPPAPAPSRTADKKKKPGFAQKDEQKKALSKRDLLKKGYVYEDSADEDGDVRYKKQRKAQRENEAHIAAKIDHAEVNTDIIPIKVFSEKIGKSAAEIVKKLFDMGKMCTITTSRSLMCPT